MNRNIVTAEDVAAAELGGQARGLPTSVVGDLKTVDDYWSRLLKQVPAEVLSGYLIIDGAVRSGVSNPQAQSLSLLVALALGTVATFFFAKNVLRIVRLSQCLGTSLAFIVAVFAIGGWFSTTTWFAPWMGSVAVIVYALYVRIARISPLPAE